MNKLLMPLVRKIFEATATPVTPGSDQEREVKALQKMYANLHRTTHQLNVSILLAGTTHS